MEDPPVALIDHLADVDIPMLFLQGTKDTLAELSLLRGLVARLGARATLKLVDDADVVALVVHGEGEVVDVSGEAAGLGVGGEVKDSERHLRFAI